MAPAIHPTRVEAPHSAGQAPKDSAPHSVTPRGNRKPWQAAWESLPIIQDAAIATTGALVGWCFLNLMDRIMFGLAVAHG